MTTASEPAAPLAPAQAGSARRPASRRRTRTLAGRLALGALILGALAIALLAPAPYLVSSLRHGAHDGNVFAAAYLGLPSWRQAGFYLHITGGGVALALIPLQLSGRLRRRSPRLHRVIGRTVATAILLSGLGSTAVVPVNHAGAVGVAGFGILAALWCCSAVLAVRAIRRRDVAAHRRWAVRTFALVYAAVTLRLWLGVLVLAGVPFDRAYHWVPFLSWVPNLVVAEGYLRGPVNHPDSRPHSRRKA